MLNKSRLERYLYGLCCSGKAYCFGSLLRDAQALGIGEERAKLLIKTNISKPKLGSDNKNQLVMQSD